MSLFSTLTSSVSGMAAQSSKLATISDNIANVNTTGYKQAATQFESLVQELDTTSYDASGVATRVRYNISEQGDLTTTNTTTDLAVEGNGFFLVEDDAGTTFLTRSGSFRQDADGNLVNAAGFMLMGYSVASGSTGADGLSALEPVNVLINSLVSAPSTIATFSANLDSTSTAVTGTLPSANTAASTFTSKSSLVAYDNLGTVVTLDLFFTKTAANTWEMSIYDAADASTGSTKFPYANAALAASTLSFSATDGSLTAPANVSVNIPNGASMTIELGKMTQLASSFIVSAATTDGSAASALDSVKIANDGTLSGVYANGKEVPIFTIPLATVPSADNLTVLPSNVYRADSNSGDILVGAAGLAGLGTIRSSTLESSTVDLASQLTDMIVAQRSYEANTKVFQTGSDLIQLLTTMLK
jgi:flagellar hook protein FlgE